MIRSDALVCPYCHTVSGRRQAAIDRRAHREKMAERREGLNRSQAGPPPSDLTAAAKAAEAEKAAEKATGAKRRRVRPGWPRARGPGVGG